MKDADPHLKGFVMAILRDLEKRNPREEESATNEQTAEKSAGETEDESFYRHFFSFKL